MDEQRGQSGLPAGLMTTEEAARALGVSPRRVVAIIKDGRLPSTRLGQIHLICEADLNAVRLGKDGTRGGRK